MYFSKSFNSNYMEFVGVETRDKLMWTSSKRCRNTNTISKQGIQKRNMNMKHTSGTLGFDCSPHKDTCDIFLESLVAPVLQEYYSINEGDVLRSTNGVKSRHEIGLPKTCVYQNSDENRC